MGSVTTAAQLAALKNILGRRRYRIAVLYYGRELTQEAIAHRLGITQQAVSKELKRIAAQLGAVKRLAAGRHRARPLDLNDSGWPPVPCMN